MCHWPLNVCKPCKQLISSFELYMFKGESYIFPAGPTTSCDAKIDNRNGHSLPSMLESEKNHLHAKYYQACVGD